MILGYKAYGQPLWINWNRQRLLPPRQSPISPVGHISREGHLDGLELVDAHDQHQGPLELVLEAPGVLRPHDPRALESGNNVKLVAYVDPFLVHEN